jgi:hypothetical protein
LKLSQYPPLAEKAIAERLLAMDQGVDESVWGLSVLLAQTHETDRVVK